MGALTLVAAVGWGGCGPSVTQIRAQAAKQLTCAPEHLVMADMDDDRWWIAGCGRQVLYGCYARDEPCRSLPMGGLQQLQAQQARSYQPAYLMPGQLQQYQQPLMPWPNPNTDIIMPGSYNPRTGTMQHSYSNQFYNPPPPPPPPLPPLTTRRF